MSWDPDRYLRFADHRTRPGVELLNRIPEIEPGRIVDLGCGTGHLTALLAERWPQATIVGIDSSPEMVSRARSDHPGIDWTVEDIAVWAPSTPAELIYSNAALHWLDDHDTLFPRLRSFLAPGGVMAVQMPDNGDAPTHRVPARILDDGDWPPSAKSALLRNRLANPPSYATWAQPAEVDMWRTTYYQRLHGPEPVWSWVTGSLLRPVLAALDGEERDRFEALCKSGYAEAYPEDDDGVTTLPFSRLFLVARAR